MNAESRKALKEFARNLPGLLRRSCPTSDMLSPNHSSIDKHSTAHATFARDQIDPHWQARVANWIQVEHTERSASQDLGELP